VGASESCYSEQLQTFFFQEFGITQSVFKLKNRRMDSLHGGLLRSIHGRRTTWSQCRLRALGNALRMPPYRDVVKQHDFDMLIGNDVGVEGRVSATQQLNHIL
jgi:hypothetical protein